MRPFVLSFILLLSFGSIRAQQADSIQIHLNSGSSPKSLIQNGVPMDSLYGMVYQGGYIFYFFPEDTSGLVIGMKNLVYHHDTTLKRVIWSCRNVNTGASETAIGSGLRNTLKIKKADCNLYDPEKKKWMESAAEVCLNYSYKGYDDWYLPSKDELHEAYMKLCFSSKINFGGKNFWTSSEKDNQFAWIEHFQFGWHEHELYGQSYFRKFYAYFVRPVRTFK